ACAGYYHLTRHSRGAILTNSNKTPETTGKQAKSKVLLELLNGLRDDINAHYGIREGVPCINGGPCGRFAKAFRQQWNARFREKVNLAFVMTPDGWCLHVVVKFSDGSYFDGGNGVMSEAKVLSLGPDYDRIEEMVQYDE